MRSISMSKKFPDFSPTQLAESAGAIARLRKGDIVDYKGVAELKWRALRAAFEKFRAHPAAGRQPGFRRVSRRTRAAAVALCLL